MVASLPKKIHPHGKNQAIYFGFWMSRNHTRVRSEQNSMRSPQHPHLKRKYTQRNEREKKMHEKSRASHQSALTIDEMIDAYLQDHEGGNHSDKTLEWHVTALGLLRTFLQEQREIRLVRAVEASDISAWFAYLRKTPGRHGKPRVERTIQTYARSVRMFFNWLVRRAAIDGVIVVGLIMRIWRQ